MKRLALVWLSLAFATPAIAADLDGPKYSEKEIIEREAPPRVVEHHHYYHTAPRREYAYEKRRVRVYEEPRVYASYDRPFYGYTSWRPRHHHFFKPWRHQRRHDHR